MTLKNNPELHVAAVCALGMSHEAATSEWVLLNAAGWAVPLKKRSSDFTSGFVSEP